MTERITTTQATTQDLTLSTGSAVETVADERLYPLLPAIYRIRDSATGEPLRALLALLEQEVNILEADIDHLYDDWFIETCAEWVVPYIGDLLGVQDLYADTATAYGQQERRAYVANTLGYRRRKGTTPILEQLARDVSGWQATVVEFGKLVNTTQHLDHLRPRSTTVNLRANNQLQEIGTPFEQQAAYSVEVRSPQNGGRYGLSNMGLFIWRLQSYPITRGMARPVAGPETCITGRYYTFSPLGKADMPLFNQPQTESDIATLAQEINIPTILRRPVLANELIERRRAFVAGEQLNGIRYFDSDPVFQIYVNGQPLPLPPEDILIARLDRDGEATPAEYRTPEDPVSDEHPWIQPENIEAIESSVSRDDPALLTKVVAVDPQLGRLVFFGEQVPQRVEVSYSYGFSEDVGGGPYGRTQRQLTPTIDLQENSDQPLRPIDPLTWTIQQTETADLEPLATAIHFWNQTVMAWQGLKDGTHFPLAKVTIPPVQVAQIIDQDKVVSFKPGIAAGGLFVRVGLCPNEIVVTSGVAIDRQGRRLELPEAKSFDLTLLELDQRPDYTGILVLTYQNQTAQNQLSVQIELLSVAQFEDLPLGLVIPLAKLTVDASNQQLKTLDLSVRLELRPGIVQGLTIGKRSGTLEAWIAAGNGVDALGRQLILGGNQELDLAPAQGEQRAVLLIYQQGDWTVQLLSLEEYETLDKPHVYLGLLDIPVVTLKIEDPLRPLPPLTVDGLVVSSLSNPAQVKLSPGSIKQGSAVVVELKKETVLDLTDYAGRSLVIFVSSRAGQGLPLEGLVAEAASVGVVPLEPESGARTGQIIIGDNGTYCHDLNILIPPDRHLQVVASDGYRPHLLGDVQVWAIAPDTPRTSAHKTIPPLPLPGELTFNGLLIEGAVQLLPGNLRRLTITHCTLVPANGGLQVIAPEPNTAPDGSEEDHEEDISLIAVLMYGLAMLWQLISQDLGLGSRFSSLTFTRTMQLFTARLLAWADTLNRVCQANQTDWAWESRQDHAQLEISLAQTLTGTITLARAVPKLKLIDCVVDQGCHAQTSGIAIAATGTDIYSLSSTLLGRVKGRSLSASDCLFTEKVTVQQRQTGCVRFCYVPVASRTPRRYQCQPDQALAENLTRVPQGISALLVQARPEQLPLVLCGTSGDGLFQFEATETEATTTEQLRQAWLTNGEWMDRSGDLTDHHITKIAALALTYSDNALPLLPEAIAPDTLIVGHANGELSYTALTGNIGAEDWRTVPAPAINAAVSVLQPIRQTGLGKVTVMGNQVIGLDTHFMDEIRPGDLFSLEDQAVHRVEQVSSDTELTLDHNHEPSVDQPSAYATHTVWLATAGGGVWKAPLEEVLAGAWQSVNECLTDRVVTALAQDASGQIWVGTATAGVFRLQREWIGKAITEQWIPENDGLCSQQITALTVDIQQQLIVGTPEGVFRRPADSETWLSTELNQGEISAIVAYASRDEDAIADLLIAGTRDGKTYRSTDGGQTWDVLSLDLRGVDITTLAVATGSSATDTEAVWAATAVGDVLFSQDGGNFWRSRHQSLPDIADKLQILQRLQPTFTATDYGAPGYAQLAQVCAIEVRTGAEDGAEVGVFNSLKQPQREANLRASIDEYLRFGLTAGIFYMT